MWSVLTRTRARNVRFKKEWLQRNPCVGIFYFFLHVHSEIVHEDVKMGSDGESDQASATSSDEVHSPVRVRMRNNAGRKISTEVLQHCPAPPHHHLLLLSFCWACLWLSEWWMCWWWANKEMLLFSSKPHKNSSAAGRAINWRVNSPWQMDGV